MVTDDPYEEPLEKLTFRIVKATPTDNQGPVERQFGNHRKGRFIESRFHVGRFNDMFLEWEPWDFWTRDIEGEQEPFEVARFSRSFRRAVRNPFAGTWRDMQITQPPWKCVEYQWDFRKTSEPPGRRRRVAPHQIEVQRQDKIVCEEGVTIGHVIDRLVELDHELEGQISWATSTIVLRSFMCPSESEEAQTREQSDSSDDETEFIGRECSPDSPDPPSTPYHELLGAQQTDNDEVGNDNGSDSSRIDDDEEIVELEELQ
ncbi:hypothetical protein Slin14017_G064670 [Septoria linicola]|nr:hypothetical protein Slin14017_G064670 [Septoria linicola]